jgi:hypothetical protein
MRNKFQFRSVCGIDSIGGVSAVIAFQVKEPGILVTAG